MSTKNSAEIQAGGAADTAVGFAFFAATMMIMVGVFQAIQGLVALFNDTFYLVGEKWTFQFDVSTWGWIHLLFGALLIAAGVFLLRGAAWARWTAVVLAGLSAVVNFMWLPYYPLWGVLVIALNVTIIWALTTHGRAVDRALR
ncbi:MAG TPA: hypothetical protein VLQ92_05820 [Candidatus Limnocylindrales bacterium]|nr:hypothetical protein [Candidatus Limnocylindrales bacterium]